MVTMSKKRKNHSNRMKITLKRVKIIPKRVTITPKKGEKHSKRVNFHFLGSSQKDSSKQKSYPSVSFTRFGITFTRFESDLHSVMFELFTLLKINHFTLLHQEGRLMQMNYSVDDQWKRNPIYER